MDIVSIDNRENKEADEKSPARQLIEAYQSSEECKVQRQLIEQESMKTVPGNNTSHRLLSLAYVLQHSRFTTRRICYQLLDTNETIIRTIIKECLS